MADWLIGEMQSPDDVLLITLDSCRYDSFRRADTPAFDRLAPLHKAQAPSYFTYASHAAIWVGFTPGVAESDQPWLNPKRGKLFRLAQGGFSGGCDGFTLQGSSIVEGFRQRGYLTVGSGAVAWFNPATPTGRLLGEPFEHFWYSGNVWSLQRQLAWIEATLAQHRKAGQPLFLFLNVGETHVPYWHEGADWPRQPSPCVPFGGEACSRRASRRRQRRCLEWVDGQLAPWLDRFAQATVLVCADHGDCWGEEGLWEHGISHPATLTVPLLIRHRGKALGDA
ncbi:sulfatase-like hydrolase/transferase [Synechococcus sp. MIT S1220]|uniref:sulfatase-like hydrolase/transferase n=1 Tax=Synechococcus sp. MIT S1220 TaxID=3082549 RepID=UPI0039B11F4C